MVLELLADFVRDDARAGRFSNTFLGGSTGDFVSADLVEDLRVSRGDD